MGARMEFRTASFLGRAASLVTVSGLIAGCGTSAATSTAASLSEHSAPAVHHIRGVLTASPDTAVQAGGVAPPQLPISKEQYDVCTSPASYRGGHSSFSFAVAGFSNASKIGESAAVGVPVNGIALGQPPDEGLLAGGSGATNPPVDGSVLSCDEITTQLDYQGQRQFPPLRATFLAFGFVPVTATAILTQVGPDPLTAVLIGKVSDPGQPFEVVATASVSLRLMDVTVNGTPLNVGANCETTGPLFSAQDPVPGETLPPGEIALVGGEGEPGDPQPAFTGAFHGGAVAGVATIPAFAGCVAPGGESLDALITSAVSGPGNYIQVDTGVPCLQQTPACASASTANGGNVANPPAVSPDWTITGGGTYAGSLVSGSSFVIATNLHSEVTCSVAEFSAAIPNQAGPPHGAPQGTAQLTFGQDCVGTIKLTRQPSGTWQVSQTGEAQLAPVDYASTLGASTFDTGHVILKITGLTLHLVGSDVPGTANGSCSVDMTGVSGLLYAQPGAAPAGTTLQWDTTGVSPLVFQVSASTCPAKAGVSAGFSVGDNVTVTGSYDLLQAGGEQAGLTFTDPSPTG